ncbi:MAG: cytochrome b/b6 domain-containing protein [Nocardioides sp.]
MSAPATVVGYPLATKVLHWLTVLLLAAQVVVGYTLDVEDGRDRVEERLEERADRAGSEAEEDRLEELADRAAARGQGPGRILDRVTSGVEPVLTTHVVLGLSLLLLTVVRLVRRRVVPLPPWAETLTEAERRWAHRTEQVLYLTLVLMPLSGLGVLLVDDDLLPVHIASHVTFYVALVLHLGLVLKHQLVDRDRLLRRML